MAPEREPTDVNVEGEIERITYESESTGFRVLRVRIDGRAEPITVVGSLPRVAEGTRIRVRGRYVNDRRHGEQLRAEHLTELLPDTLQGVERYLGSGKIRGIGPGFAKRIVAVFGMDTLRVLDETPERLAEVPGLGSRRADELARDWNEQRKVREVMVFLQAHGATAALASRIHRRYGSSAVRVVSEEPYRLAIEVWGIGFKTADRLARGLGIASDAPARIQAGVLQAVHDVTESGHTCVGEDDLRARALALLELDDLTSEPRDGAALIGHALRSLTLSGHLFVETLSSGERLYFSREMHEAEVRLAQRFVGLTKSGARKLPGAEEAMHDFERRANVTLADEQRRAVEEATVRGVLVITGGPGVGKTTIVRAILSIFDRARLRTRLAAPTGRAAKRITESTGRDASTLHRLLDFDPKRAEFKRNADNPIDCDAVVVDEASMIDVEMADALAQAVAQGTRLVLVGDVDQLPSVGPGAVLRDVIASEVVPCVRLTRIFRQEGESQIVVSAHQINHGETPTPSRAEGTDFFMIDRRDPDAARSTIVELVTERIPRRFGFDPVRDIQVLTPMHRGPAGSIALNEALQAALNPSGNELVRGARTFRVGDKVMQLKNDYERDVWNGDLGVITELDAEQDTLRVRFDEGREVPYEAASLDELTLAYACSVHKSQGSEYPAVVVPLLTTHFVMLSKNLLYTAVTRGKKLVVLVYDPRALSIALAADRRGERRTRLEARLRTSATSAT